jgi:hypothetical protein
VGTWHERERHERERHKRERRKRERRKWERRKWERRKWERRKRERRKWERRKWERRKWERRGPLRRTAAAAIRMAAMGGAVGRTPTRAGAAARSLKRRRPPVRPRMREPVCVCAPVSAEPLSPAANRGSRIHPSAPSLSHPSMRRKHSASLGRSAAPARPRAVMGRNPARCCGACATRERASAAAAAHVPTLCWLLPQAA